MARVHNALGASFVVGLSIAAGCGTSSTGSDFNLTGGDGGADVDSGIGSFGDGNGGDDDGSGNTGPCVGLQCNQVICAGGRTTSLTGKVYDPSGTVPIYNAVVYVPNADLDSFIDGVTCDQCGTTPSGKPIATALTDASGAFTLENVPVGVDIPLVVQVGRWRRKVTIKPVVVCESTPLDASITRLPRNRTEGDIPKIAIATGGWDSLECFFRRLGIDDSEFTNPNGNGRVHLYQGLDSVGHGRDGAYIDGSTPAAQTLWDDLETLKKYNMVILSCEGSENLGTKSDAARSNLKQYLDVGGRVFASHYHYTWFKNSSSLSTTATWKAPDPDGHGTNLDVLVDTTVPKGQAFSDWLDAVGASTPGQPGSVSMIDIKSNVASVAAESHLWLYAGDKVSTWTSSYPGNQDNTEYFKGPKYFSFNTPIGESADKQCGRGVYTDIHVSTPDQTSQTETEDWPGVQFPTGCRKDPTMTPQEKALLFLMMDLASCIQDDSQEPVPPPIVK